MFCTFVAGEDFVQCESLGGRWKEPAAPGIHSCEDNQFCSRFGEIVNLCMGNPGRELYFPLFQVKFLNFAIQRPLADSQHGGGFFPATASEFQSPGDVEFFDFRKWTPDEHV